jgi:hypothetical protein
VGHDLSTTDTTDSLTVQLDGYDHHEFIDFLRYLADQKHLTKLEKCCSESPQDAFRTRCDVALLSSVICDLSNLEDIALYNFGHESNDLLTLCLKDKPYLPSVRLHYLRGTVNQELLHTIADLPSLYDVVLEMQKDFPFYILFSPETLKSLKINGTFTFDRKTFEYAMQLLCTNATLETLDMEPKVPQQVSVRSISYAIEANTTLEILFFSFQARSKATAGEALLEITKALSCNSNLRELVNYRSRSVQILGIHQDLAIEFMEEPNKTLQKFKFYKDGLKFADDEDNNSVSQFIPSLCQSSQLDSWIPHCGALDNMGFT